MVLSYTTSPAYHLIAESDDTKAAALFDEGHYLQVEVAGKLAATDQPELADQFLAFMLTDAFQSVIPTDQLDVSGRDPGSRACPKGLTPDPPGKIAAAVAGGGAGRPRRGAGRMASRAGRD